MKKNVLAFLSIFIISVSAAQTPETIKLPEVNFDRGTSAMQAFRDRQSVREYVDRQISTQDLSDLLWAANGFNRPDKRTAATAMNAQEIDLYVCLESGAYLYNAKGHSLEPVTSEDIRPEVGRGEDAKKPPLCLIIVADMSRTRNDNETSRLMSAYDAGIVSQNIYIFCAANGIGTVCRAGGMDKRSLAKGLKLTDKHIIHLNHPVGYLK